MSDSVSRPTVTDQMVREYAEAEPIDLRLLFGSPACSEAGRHIAAIAAELLTLRAAVAAPAPDRDWPADPPNLELEHESWCHLVEYSHRDDMDCSCWVGAHNDAVAAEIRRLQDIINAQKPLPASRTMQMRVNSAEHQLKWLDRQNAGLRAAVSRVRELHQAEPIGSGPDVLGCSTCHAVMPETWGPDLLQPGESLWPCETVRALDGEA